MSVSKDEILAKLHQLPSIPLVIQQVMASFSNDKLGRTVLANLIAQDQGLSARVLRVANSTFYGLSRTIASIQDAVMVMGFDSVRSLVLSAGFVHVFPPVSGTPFNRNTYWRHSFRVAGYAKALAQSLQQDQQMAFTAAMFHDVGQLVLDVCIPEQFASVLIQREITGVSLIDAEQAEFGFDHAMIGAEMARNWNFPPEIEHAIRYWRTPAHGPFEPITGILHVAVLLENGVRGDELVNQLPNILRERLGINWRLIEAGLPDIATLDDGADVMLAV